MAQEKLEETLNFRMSKELKAEWAAFAIAGGKGASVLLRETMIAADVSVVGVAKDLVDKG